MHDVEIRSAEMAEHESTVPTKCDKEQQLADATDEDTSESSSNQDTCSNPANQQVNNEVVTVAKEAAPSSREEAPTRVDLDDEVEDVEVTPPVEEKSGPEDESEYGADEEQPTSPGDEAIRNLDETVVADSDEGRPSEVSIPVGDPDDDVDYSVSVLGGVEDAWEEIVFHVIPDEPIELVNEEAVVTDEPGALAVDGGVAADEAAAVADEEAVVADEPAAVPKEEEVVIQEPAVISVIDVEETVAKELTVVSDEEEDVAKELAVVPDEEELVAMETVVVHDEEELVAKETVVVHDEEELVAKELAVVPDEEELVTKEQELAVVPDEKEVATEEPAVSVEKKSLAAVTDVTPKAAVAAKQSDKIVGPLQNGILFRIILVVLFVAFLVATSKNRGLDARMLVQRPKARGVKPWRR